MLTLDFYPLIYGLALTLQETQLGTSERRTTEKKLIAACKEPKVGKAIIRALRRQFAMAPEIDRAGYVVSVGAAGDFIQSGYAEKEMLSKARRVASIGMREVWDVIRTELAIKKRREYLEENYELAEGKNAISD